MEPVFKQTKKLLHRAEITNDPQKAIQDYFQLKNDDNQHVKQYPKWDIPRENPSAELIRSRYQLSKIENDMKYKIDEQKSKRTLLDQQWNDYEQKQKDLQESFIIFDKFVRENQEKRERAKYKISEEVKRQASLTNDVEEITKKLDHMKGVLNKMDSYVKQYKIYQTYLDSVINVSDEFKYVNDILNRYEALIEARTVILENQDRNWKVLERTGIDVYHMIENKKHVLTGLNNKLALLQEKFDDAKARTYKWETIISRIKHAAAIKKLELTLIQACCWNMYQQICQRKNIPINVDRNDLEQQLNHIKRTIVKLNNIVKDCEMTVKNEKKNHANKTV